MPWGFKKRIKIAPGLHINIGKTGVSARVGGRVAGVTVGRRGAQASANLPGTGLSVRHKITTRTSSSQDSPQTAADLTDHRPKSRKWRNLFIIAGGLATGIAVSEVFF